LIKDTNGNAAGLSCKLSFIKDYSYNGPAGDNINLTGVIVENATKFQNQGGACLAVIQNANILHNTFGGSSTSRILISNRINFNSTITVSSVQRVIAYRKSCQFLVENTVVPIAYSTADQWLLEAKTAVQNAMITAGYTTAVMNAYLAAFFSATNGTAIIDDINGEPIFNAYDNNGNILDYSMQVGENNPLNNSIFYTLYDSLIVNRNEIIFDTTTIKNINAAGVDISATNPPSLITVLSDGTLNISLESEDVRNTVDTNVVTFDEGKYMSSILLPYLTNNIPNYNIGAFDKGQEEDKFQTRISVLEYLNDVPTGKKILYHTLKETMCYRKIADGSYITFADLPGLGITGSWKSASAEYGSYLVDSNDIIALQLADLLSTSTLKAVQFECGQCKLIVSLNYIG
jgi:hypothetical protein